MYWRTNEVHYYKAPQDIAVRHDKYDPIDKSPVCSSAAAAAATELSAGAGTQNDTRRCSQRYLYVFTISYHVKQKPSCANMCCVEYVSLRPYAYCSHNHGVFFGHNVFIKL